MACNCLPALTFPASAPTGVLMRDLASGNEVDCPICADPLTADSTAHPWTGPAPFLVEGCANGHVYHKGCLLTWVARAPGAVCPDCRAPLLPAVVQSLQSQGTPSPAPAPAQRRISPESAALARQRHASWRRAPPARLPRPPQRQYPTPSAVARERQLNRQDEQLRQRRRQRAVQAGRRAMEIDEARRSGADQAELERRFPEIARGREIEERRRQSGVVNLRELARRYPDLFPNQQPQEPQ